MSRRGAQPAEVSDTLEMLHLHTGDGHGSTNTAIRIFKTAAVNTGGSFTYSTSASSGMQILINTPGWYFINFSDRSTTTNSILGLSVNVTAELATSIESVSGANQLAYMSTQASVHGCVSVLRKFSAGDIIRAHTNGLLQETASNTQLILIKVPTP